MWLFVRYFDDYESFVHLWIAEHMLFQSASVGAQSSGFPDDSSAEDRIVTIRLPQARRRRVRSAGGEPRGRQ